MLLRQWTYGLGQAPVICHPWLSPARVLDHGRGEGEFASSFCGHARYRGQGFRPLGGAGRAPASVGTRLDVAAAVVDVSARGAPHCRGDSKPERPTNRVTAVGLGRLRANRAAFGPAGSANQTTPWSTPFGAGQRYLGGLRGLVRCERGLQGLFATIQAPTGIG